MYKNLKKVCLQSFHILLRSIAALLLYYGLYCLWPGAVRLLGS